MLTVTREEKDGVFRLKLSGTVDEHVSFDELIGELPPKVEVVCRDLSQINSLGVKAWVDFWAKMTGRGTELLFSECPPPIVEQLNYITNFSGGGTVVSVSVPFNCEKCHKELRGIVKSEDLRKVAYKLPPVKCPKCNAKAHFDDSPEDYFAFLIRQSQGS